MTRYLAVRLVEMAGMIAAMSLIVYMLIGLMPGDPINMMIAGDPRMTSEDAARLRALYELDKPLLQRYLAWAWQALHGNFGYSRSFGQPVLAVLGPRLANTLKLAGLAFLISTAIALPLGMWAAHRPRSRADYLINLFCFAGISMPPFWLALLLITLFAVTLGWLPAGGMADLRAGAGWLDVLGQTLRHLVLPGLVRVRARAMRPRMLGISATELTQILCSARTSAGEGDFQPRQPRHRRRPCGCR